MKLIHQSGAARCGSVETHHGRIESPFFMPIATKGAVKTLSPADTWELQQAIDQDTTPIVLSNTYHLYLQPGLNVLKAAGGLRKLMNWDGTMLTDSGGFQIFSLSKLRRVTEDGVEFRSHRDGSTHMITPEVSMEIQSVIASSIWMAFDFFPGYPADRDEVEASVDRTTAWARRCKEWSEDYRERTGSEHQLFGIVQGSTFDDLRQRSAQELIALDFDGYAVGGLAVGEPAEVMYDVLDATVPLLPTDKPRYLMGVGTPEQILEAVKRGIDMFDCVMPTRNARHGTVFVHTDESLVDSRLDTVAYKKLNIRSAKFASDQSVLDEHCSCETCLGGNSKAYIRHLFSVGEPLAARLATIHNVHFYLMLMKEIRDAITESSSGK